MYCPKCGAQIADGSAFCPKCGAGVAEPQSAPSPVAPVMRAVKNNGMAVASLVLGIVGFVINPALICSILAIIFGAIGMGQVNRSNGAQKGKGMAVAGLILGIVSIVFMIIIFIVIGFSLTWISDIGSHISTY